MALFSRNSQTYPCRTLLPNHETNIAGKRHSMFVTVLIQAVRNSLHQHDMYALRLFTYFTLAGRNHRARKNWADEHHSLGSIKWCLFTEKILSGVIQPPYLHMGKIWNE
ncbi:hypothetical protein AVEN_156454-1 [Araneus ventricosus]|uniref:Uncharacterized protein n=1 Tax=Araneus ventricosus TaxID=182803 RepID=A0A4Y2SY03_ARAVE|nr:hypothetical protein AVEN_137167-1 [Araneus ventricosus]GBN91765.1 hypothetical protein AVEN_156454-1 [Araneus ventricosus]